MYIQALCVRVFYRWLHVIGHMSEKRSTNYKTSESTNNHIRKANVLSYFPFTECTIFIHMKINAIENIEKNSLKLVGKKLLF
jgi:hypothetical protein